MDTNNYFADGINVSKSLDQNLEYIKSVFMPEKNFDFVIREFDIGTATPTRAFLIFFDGLANKEFINRDIMNPLMTADAKADSLPLEELISKRMLTQAPNSKLTKMSDILDLVCFGNCAVFAEGCNCAFVADVKGWGTRSVGRPVAEAVLSGPQEAFCETVMTNISLVRKILKSPRLMSENIPVGTISKTPCALMYIEGTANPGLVAEARRRLEGIATDYIFSSSEVEMLIEDSTLLPLPQILKTERPDRAAAQLGDGKIAIIVQGSPFVLILPVTARDLIESAEDNYVRIPEANFMKLIRTLGCLIAIFLPGIFTSIMLYHHESLPTDLLFAVAASRGQMPFPIIMELVLMLFSFELIKEASIRVPDTVGSTLGIVGGLILGQAAVSANIASPLLIIIVSIAALGAFAAPSTAISRAITLLQFAFVVLGGLSGFLGIAFGSFALWACFASVQSFGLPYAAFGKNSLDPILVKPIWKRETRPNILSTQNPKKQPKISRGWRKED